jgi:predicted O-methyltransferase YrrM
MHMMHVFKPKAIIEVGTWSGDNAIRLISNAKQYWPQVWYDGYDLFDSATAETDATELNVKKHFTRIDVETKIRNATSGFGVVKLVQGNTRETLKADNITGYDFAFIDGGHSVETIEHDYEQLKHVPVVVLDDYYTSDVGGVGPDIEKYGCNKLVDKLRSQGVACHVLPGKDYVKDGGFNQLVLVLNV